MLNSIIAGSLKHRALVLAASAILLIAGAFVGWLASLALPSRTPPASPPSTA